MGHDLPVFVFGCVSCGKTVAGTEKACPRCGASFENLKFECPFCGTLVSPMDMKCAECGTGFGEFAEAVADMSAIDLDSAEDTSPDLGDAEKATQSHDVAYECPNCGKPVSETDTECPNCGVKFG